MTRGSPADDAGKVPPASGGTAPRDEEQESEERIVVRDRRRIDPNGTQPRSTATADPGAADVTTEEAAEPATPQNGTDGGGTDTGGAAPADVESLRKELDERTRDLKRVVAEYANYRRRVDRDRALAGEQATGSLLSSLLPVLDDLDRAREHGDLVGPFASVADQLNAVLTKAGLTSFGEAGDPFDPMHHEAVAHSLSPDVTEPTCVMIMRRGYRHGEKMLRPAMVAVADPEPEGESAAASEAAAEPVAAADAAEQDATTTQGDGASES